jgi:hypothetical protein
MLAVLAEAGHHLFGQFARRHQHQGADAVAGHGFVAFAQALQQGQGEAGGLAGAGLRRRHQVAAGQHGREWPGLNRRRFLIAKRVESLEERCGEAELREGHGGKGGCERQRKDEGLSPPRREGAKVSPRNARKPGIYLGVFFAPWRLGGAFFMCSVLKTVVACVQPAPLPSSSRIWVWNLRMVERWPTLITVVCDSSSCW